MLATLSTTVWDFSGYIELDLVSDYTDGEVRRRVNRTATLDGGAVLADGGFSDADRTLQFRWKRMDAEREAAVERLISNYGSILVSAAAGVFLAAPEVYIPTPDESTLRLLVLERLST